MEGTPTGKKDTSHFSNTKFILEAGNTCRKYGLVYLSQEDLKIPVVKYSCDPLDCPLTDQAVTRDRARHCIWSSLGPSMAL